MCTAQIVKVIEMAASLENHPELLDRRPEARTFKVEDLLTDVRLGRIRIPSFQRDLSWQRGDALKLLDSIYRGYPIQTLLLWETKAEADTLRFGSVTIHADARENALWVVDGQQRTVSLIRTLIPEEPTADSFALFFDLDLGEFLPPPSKSRLGEDQGRWLPATVIVDSERLFQWLLQHVSTTQRREKAIQLGKRIREYDIPAYIVKTDSEQVLREVFDRVNNSGKRLEANEVFDALHGARSGQRPATFLHIVNELEELGFGRVEEKMLYRLLRVLMGADVTDRSGEGVLRLPDGKAVEAYTLTAKVAKEVVQFLKRDVGIAHYDLLPYKQPLVTLGKFFQYHSSPKARSRELLVRWLWRGALTGAHRGDTVSTRRSIDQIDPTSEELSVQRMLQQVTSDGVEFPRAEGAFNFRHAGSKLQTLALLDLKPRDLDSGELISIGDLLSGRRSEEDLPFAALFQSGAANEILHRSVANRLVHPRRPGIRRALQHSSPEILSSHLIDRYGAELLVRGDLEMFLSHRSLRLDQHFESFFKRRARWGESDRPSIASLVVADSESI
jgi:hypothetical protein